MKTHRIMACLLTLSALLTCACVRQFDVRPGGSGTDRPDVMFPNYRDVTIPCNLAPLNFYYTDHEGDRFVTTFSCGGSSVTFKGREVVWKEKSWKENTRS